MSMIYEASQYEIIPQLSPPRLLVYPSPKPPDTYILHSDVSQIKTEPICPLCPVLVQHYENKYMPFYTHTKLRNSTVVSHKCSLMVFEAKPISQSTLKIHDHLRCHCHRVLIHYEGKTDQLSFREILKQSLKTLKENGRTIYSWSWTKSLWGWRSPMLSL